MTRSISAEDAPFLTVAEAAIYMRISKGLAYEMARAYLATNGTTGLCCIRFGHRILVPRAPLERLAVDGPFGSTV